MVTAGNPPSGWVCASWRKASRKVLVMRLLVPKPAAKIAARLAGVVAGVIAANSALGGVLLNNWLDGSFPAEYRALMSIVLGSSMSIPVA